MVGWVAVLIDSVCVPVEVSYRGTSQYIHCCSVGSTLMRVVHLALVATKLATYLQLVHQAKVSQRDDDRLASTCFS